MTTPSVVADAALLALSLADDGDAPAALAALVRLSTEHPGDPELAEAWAGLADATATQSAFGVTLLSTLIPIAGSWPDPHGQATLFMVLAELEVLHREATWSAHWLKKAMASHPADPRPWDLLEVLLDDHPTLPVGRDTLKTLRVLRQARGELPINEDDFAGATFDEWDEGGTADTHEE